MGKLQKSPANVPFWCLTRHGPEIVGPTPLSNYRLAKSSRVAHGTMGTSLIKSCSNAALVVTTCLASFRWLYGEPDAHCFPRALRHGLRNSLRCHPYLTLSIDRVPVISAGRILKRPHLTVGGETLLLKMGRELQGNLTQKFVAYSSRILPDLVVFSGAVCCRLFASAALLHIASYCWRATLIWLPDGSVRHVLRLEK